MDGGRDHPGPSARGTGKIGGKYTISGFFFHSHHRRALSTWVFVSEDDYTDRSSIHSVNHVSVSKILEVGRAPCVIGHPHICVHVLLPFVGLIVILETGCKFTIQYTMCLLFHLGANPRLYCSDLDPTAL